MGKHRRPDPSKYETAKKWFWSICRVSFIKDLVLTPRYLFPISILLLIADTVLSTVIVQNVKYTEIDWRAYMDEVEGFLNGSWNYAELKGDTGPCVYPAGFLYIYSVLYYVTGHGSNVRTAQYIFVLLYIVNLFLVFRMYVATKKVPTYVLAMMCFTTYRIHSIFVLRLFNDPFATALLYAALNLFLSSRWTLGSIFFSLAVSVKMNILLYSPALLIAYLTSLSIPQTVLQLGICGVTQVLLGLPFLYENPVAYIKAAFNLGRVFEHKWTVNWRFLPEATFVNPYFHGALLAGHVFTLCLFANIFIVYLRSYARLKTIEKDLKKGKSVPIEMSTVAQLFLYPLFVSNFIGVVFSRSLHYQFYVWYYHTLPYLLWSTSLSVTMRLTLLGVIELCWNTYPSTDFSSALLHACHAIILVNLYRTGKERTKID